MNVVVRLACLITMWNLATSAHAQSIAFISAKGADNANCYVTTPCRTLFQGITVVESGGTVVVLDSGEFDSIAIAKSVTIDATGVVATIITPATAVLINGTNIDVTLRNLNLDVGLGSVGIQFREGATLIAEDVKIRNLTTGAGILFRAENGAMTLRNVSIVNTVNGNSPGAIVVDTSAGFQYSLTVENSLLSRNSRGIVVQGNGSAQLSIGDTTISKATGFGVFCNPSGGTHKIEISDSKIVNSSNAGLYLAPTGGSTRVSASLQRSSFSNDSIGIRADALSASQIRIALADVSASNNNIGIYATGNTAMDAIRTTVAKNSSTGISMTSPALMRIGSSVVTGNGVGLAGTVSSYGNNQLLGNTTQGSATPVPPGSVP